MNDKMIKNELIKRYIYLCENKELILALCIDRSIDRKCILSKIREYKRLLKTNVVCKSNKELSKMIKQDIDYYKKKLTTDNYYLMTNVNDTIIYMFENFLFSDNEMEGLDLYKHIEAVKKNKDFLEAFNYSIELLEERKKGNRQKKISSAFTVWKILDYVRRMADNDKLILDALDKYYNIDRFMITGDDYTSGYYLLECDYDNLGEESLNKYPNNLTDNNSFEEEDNYFARKPWKTNNFYASCLNVTYSYFMLKLALMPNLDIEDKEIIKRKLNNNKVLVK